jgi:hypothetical protein
MTIQITVFGTFQLPNTAVQLTTAKSGNLKWHRKTEAFEPFDASAHTDVGTKGVF